MINQMNRLSEILKLDGRIRDLKDLLSGSCDKDRKKDAHSSPHKREKVRLISLERRLKGVIGNRASPLVQ